LEFLQSEKIANSVYCSWVNRKNFEEVKQTGSSALLVNFTKVFLVVAEFRNTRYAQIRAVMKFSVFVILQKFSDASCNPLKLSR